MTHQVAPEGVTRGRVLAYLAREADLDGLVAVSEREVGLALGMTQESAHHHIATLRSVGLLAYAGRVGRRTRGGQVIAYQLSEEAMT